MIQTHNDNHFINIEKQHYENKTNRANALYINFYFCRKQKG